MRNLARFALTIGAVVLFASCGASQGPIGALGAVAQSGASGAPAHRASGTSGDLLYALDSFDAAMITYPEGVTLKRTAKHFGAGRGMCSDADGDVWIVGQLGGDPPVLYKYLHGGTKPITKLHAPKSLGAVGCAVDPKSDDLAVNLSDPDKIAVWHNGQGLPRIYNGSGFALTYDSHGNLFYPGGNRGFGLFELPKGSQTIKSITLDKPTNVAGNIQWDGQYLAVANGGASSFPVIYRVETEGSIGHVTQTVHLRGAGVYAPWFWIQGDTLITQNTRGCIVYFHYPRGGKPFKTVRNHFCKRGNSEWLTVSAVPSR